VGGIPKPLEGHRFGVRYDDAGTHQALECVGVIGLRAGVDGVSANKYCPAGNGQFEGALQYADMGYHAGEYRLRTGERQSGTRRKGCFLDPHSIFGQFREQSRAR
jgi:hypothetical protein